MFNFFHSRPYLTWCWLCYCVDGDILCLFLLRSFHSVPPRPLLLLCSFRAGARTEPTFAPGHLRSRDLGSRFDRNFGPIPARRETEVQVAHRTSTAVSYHLQDTPDHGMRVRLGQDFCFFSVAEMTASWLNEPRIAPDNITSHHPSCIRRWCRPSRRKLRSRIRQGTEGRTR